MDFSAFSNIVKSKDLSGVYLLYGEEEYIKDLAVKTVVETYIDKGLKDLNYDKIDASQADISDVEKAMIQFPMMSEKRVAVVHSLPLFSMTLTQLKQSGNQSDLEKIKSYIEKCPETSVILFVARGTVPASVTKIFSESDRAVEFKYPTAQKKIQYVQRMAKEESLIISSATAKLLLDYTGMELLDLSQEVKKLKAYCNDMEVTSQDIYDVCSAAVEYNVFQMLKYISAGNGAKALAEYRKLILAGQSPQAVISIIEKQYRALFYMNDINQANVAEYKTMANKLSTKDFVIKNMKREASRLSDDKIRKIAEWCADADYMVKRGKISVDNSAEMLIINLINI